MGEHLFLHEVNWFWTQISWTSFYYYKKNVPQSTEFEPVLSEPNRTRLPLLQKVISLQLLLNVEDERLIPCYWTRIPTCAGRVQQISSLSS